MLPLINMIDSELEQFFSRFYPQDKPYDFLNKWISGEKYEECHKYDYQLDNTNREYDWSVMSVLQSYFRRLEAEVQYFLEQSSSGKVNDRDWYKSDILYVFDQLNELYSNDCIQAEFKEDLIPSDIYNVVYVKYVEPIYDLINKYPFKVWA